MFAAFLDWLSHAWLIMLGSLLLICMMAVGTAASAFRRFQDRRQLASDTKAYEHQESYIVSAVLGLLALLLAFTFSLATDRFDVRRMLVMQETNAIGTAFLRAQLLGEPHRARLSQLLIEYTDNKIALAKANGAAVTPLLAADDKLLTDIWAAAAAAFDSIKGLDFSSTFVDSMNVMIDLDASRRAARQAQVPTEVFIVLLAYMIVTAGILGYALTDRRSRVAGRLLMGLAILSLLLILDIDQPLSGGITVSQRPMEQLLASLKSQPTSVYDRWRMAEPAP